MDLIQKKPEQSLKETPPASSHDWGLQQNIAFLMACVLSHMDQDLRDTVLRDMNLTYVHYRVLQVLYDKDGQSIGELARILVLRQPAVSRIIDQMEERELAMRRPNPANLRYTEVWLTHTGRKRYEEAWPEAQSIITSALSIISNEERSFLLNILSRMDAHLRD